MDYMIVADGESTGWCQRIKSEFVFEYKFLEDELS
jgi:CCR4-NOT transcriptional regulation complex NOT5 subunit